MNQPYQELSDPLKIHKKTQITNILIKTGLLLQAVDLHG